MSVTRGTTSQYWFVVIYDGIFLACFLSETLKDLERYPNGEPVLHNVFMEALEIVLIGRVHRAALLLQHQLPHLMAQQKFLQLR